jgi:hypothetical protein
MVLYRGCVTTVLLGPHTKQDQVNCRHPGGVETKIQLLLWQVGMPEQLLCQIGAQLLQHQAGVELLCRIAIQQIMSQAWLLGHLPSWAALLRRIEELNFSEAGTQHCICQVWDLIFCRAGDWLVHYFHDLKRLV